MRNEPNESEVRDFMSKDNERAADAVNRYRSRSGLHISDALTGLRLYAAGEEWGQLDPFALLQRIRVLEGRPMFMREGSETDIACAPKEAP